MEWCRVKTLLSYKMEWSSWWAQYNCRCSLFILPNHQNRPKLRRAPAHQKTTTTKRKINYSNWKKQFHHMTIFSLCIFQPHFAIFIDCYEYYGIRDVMRYIDEKAMKLFSSFKRFHKIIVALWIFFINKCYKSVSLANFVNRLWIFVFGAYIRLRNIKSVIKWTAH